MELVFTSSYQTILEKIEKVNPIAYGKTRNYVNGDVTYLSPYLSRGVISTKQILENVLSRGYKVVEIESFVKELCWRDYFQRIGQVKDLTVEIRQQQIPVLNMEIPTDIVNACTGILGIDTAITKLYATGYMHNHCRMYTASVVCNIGKSHWFLPARWMYYHLLDGDWASNACSWQWVAGANSTKKYYANQENINKYTLTHQSNTFLDVSYEHLVNMSSPDALLNTQTLSFETTLPKSELLKLDANFPTFLYNYYNLDPQWHLNETGNRVLIIEPQHFANYPISKKCLEFMLNLSKNIPNMQVYVGSFQSLLQQYSLKIIYYKEHPLNLGYKGIQEPRDWITETIDGYYPSFFSYWKKVEKQIWKRYA